MSGIFVAGTGMYVPPKTVTNEDLAKLVDTSDEWVRERTGIRERRVTDGEPVWMMGKKAALEALENAGIGASDVDMIIACSITPDFSTPSLACVLQGEIGADGALCWDLNAACSGFIYALDAASRYLATGGASTVLIVCSEALTKITDFTDRSTCVLFGDGAGAVVVRRDERRLFESYLKSEGKSGGVLFARTPPIRTPFSDRSGGEEYRLFKQTSTYGLNMEGREVYRFATRVMPLSVRAVCEKAGLAVEELDLIVPHQANVRIVRTAAERLGVEMSKMAVDLDRYGNTSCSSIPICLTELSRSGRLRRGAKIVLAGFGAGLTYGAVAMEW